MRRSRFFSLAPLWVILWLPVVAQVVLTGCGEGPLPGFTENDEQVQAADFMPFTTGGFVVRWQAGTILTIDLPNATGTPGGQASMNIAFRDGVAVWNGVMAAMGMSVGYVLNAADDIQVIWDDGSGVPIGVLGFAQVNTLASPSRFMVITTRCNNCGNTINSDALIRTIAMHEFGHMLGIWNHSFDPADLMFPLAVGQTGLSRRDGATMARAYQFPADLNLAALPANPLIGETITADLIDGTLPPQEGADGIAIRETFGYNSQHAGIEFVFPESMRPLTPGLE